MLPPTAPALPDAAASVLPPMQAPALPPVLARLLNGGTAPGVAMSPFAPLSTLTAGAMFSGQIAPVPGFVSPPIVSTVPAPTSLAPPTTVVPSLPPAPLPTPTAPPPSTVAAAAPPGFYFNPTPEHFNALALYQGLLQAGSSSMPSSSFEPSASHGRLVPDPHGYGGAYGGTSHLGLAPAPAATPDAAPPGPLYGVAPPPVVPSPAAYAMAGAPAGGVAPFYIAHLIPVKLSPDN
nr:leucine-rich repeat extensin-like protein 5 [Lolium perenne]